MNNILLRLIKRISPKTPSLLLMALSLGIGSALAQQNILKYTKPAQDWESEFLPAGNGLLGAMVKGGTDTEVISLNEKSVWSGGKNPEGNYNYGPQAGVNDMGCYLPVGDLIILSPQLDEPEQYARTLDLATGMVNVQFRQKGVNYKRQVFVSRTHNVIAVLYVADKPGSLNFSYTMRPQLSATMKADKQGMQAVSKLENGLVISTGIKTIVQGGEVEASSQEAVNIPVSYADKGSVSQTFPMSGASNVSKTSVVDADALPTISVKNASSCVFLISIATNYNGIKELKSEQFPVQQTSSILDAAAKTPIKKLRKDHMDAHGALFNRMVVNLGTSEKDISSLPTDERLERYRQGKNDDPELEALLYQFGRYALISSTSPTSLPANLQGIWNRDTSPAWACDYHSNINTQMNYWAADVANLSELHRSLLNYLKDMEPAYIASCKEALHTDEGWTTRTSQNIYGGMGWEWNLAASAWYAHHMWDHYSFTQDQAFLKNTLYPMMKRITQFWEAHLKTLDKDGANFSSEDGSINRAELQGIPSGTLVAPNGWSPEHGPREDGVAHDQQLITELLENTVKAARTLHVDQEWANTIEDKKNRLFGPKIGKEGNLQEWMIDRDPHTDHRHTSHLYAVYPGTQISPSKTPLLAEAAKKSLLWRGSSGDSRRSWTWPWRCALWARLLDAEKSYEMVQGLLQYNIFNNFLATHPPMQIDGTLGITGAMSEMLIQSHDEHITLLPALPEQWKASGSIRGIKARGNITVDFAWKNGLVTSYAFYSSSPEPISVVINGKTTRVKPTSPARKDKPQNP